MTEISVQQTVSPVQIVTRGPRGLRGYSLELRVNDGVLEWRVEKANPDPWQPLIDLSEFLEGSETARALARKWAAEDEDIVVADGLYSALHYAAKAYASAQAAGSSASTAAGAKNDAENARDAAQAHATTADEKAGDAASAASTAESARDKAAMWAEEDTDVEVEPGKYSAKHYAEKAEAAAENAAIFDPSNYYSKTDGALDEILGAKADLDEDGKVVADQLPFAEEEDVATATGTGLVNAAHLAIAIGALAGEVVTEVFTTSGTFTKADDDFCYYVECIGGGGSGSVSSDSTSRRGGGGGEFKDVFVTPDQLSETTPVIVGAGGAAVTGSNGNDGGDSSFGGLVDARGGEGGGVGMGRGGGGQLPGNALAIENGSGGYSSGGGAAGNGTGGRSTKGGNGGNGTGGADGATPGDGGGGAASGTSGAGYRGEVRIYRFKRVKQ